MKEEAKASRRGAGKALPASAAVPVQEEVQVPRAADSVVLPPQVVTSAGSPLSAPKPPVVTRRPPSMAAPRRRTVRLVTADEEEGDVDVVGDDEPAAVAATVGGDTDRHASAAALLMFADTPVSGSAAIDAHAPFSSFVKEESVALLAQGAGDDDGDGHDGDGGDAMLASLAVSADADIYDDDVDGRALQRTYRQSGNHGAAQRAKGALAGAGSRGRGDGAGAGKRGLGGGGSVSALGDGVVVRPVSGGNKRQRLQRVTMCAVAPYVALSPTGLPVVVPVVVPAAPSPAVTTAANDSDGVPLAVHSN